MLKTQTLTLTGRDEGLLVTLREKPALIADRYARDILNACDLPDDGGVVALAFKYLTDVRKALGEDALHVLDVFVDATYADNARPRDYRTPRRLQDASLMLCAGFIATREAVTMPITMQAETIKAGTDARVTFCSPFIAAVLDSGKASYVELETVLGTEDAYNLAEILNVGAIRDWRAAQRNKT